MEIYTLDSLLRRTEVVDVFDSMIWTERFADFGDFELHVPSTADMKKLFVTGTKLAINESYRTMVVETVEDANDAEGKKILNITGRSLETFMENRGAIDVMGSPKWVLTDTPTNIARTIFNNTMSGNLDPGDRLPFLTAGNLFPEDTIPEPTDFITLELTPTSLDQPIKQLATTYDFGFRLLRNFDASQLYFDIYTGTDRTTFQSILDPVIFATYLDSLQNTKELTTIAGSKNVAYVFSPAGFQIVYADGVDPDIDGFDRRVLTVNASDIEAGDPDATTKMIQAGKQELAKNQSYSAFDGELNQHGNYKYGVNYQLGDLVETRNELGAINSMRVTEQIFVSDDQGDRSYPTLSIRNYIAPNTWYGWNQTQIWSDLDATTYWENV